MSRGGQTIRQWQLLRLICSSTSMTVEKLADRLQVHNRTIRRDIAVLEEAGFPIYVRTGGYGELSYRLDKDWFTRDAQGCPHCNGLSYDNQKSHDQERNEVGPAGVRGRV